MDAVPGAWRRRAHVALAALVLVGLDAPKPLVVDDAAYIAFARQIAAHPLDPYGFEIYWRHEPEPAFDVLAPPLLPYWLAGSMALLGDEPVRWKLALFPFGLALASALWRLSGRFAPGLEAPLVWMGVLSPSVLPFLNLMLDIPAAALSLLALALFLAACDRPGLARAAAAGLLGGLAMQTKYTAATGVACMLAWGVLHGRPRHALLAVAAAAGVFWGWEGLLALRYGDSHLLNAVAEIQALQRGASPHAALDWGLGFLTILGAVAPAIGVLGLAALGGSRRIVGSAALVVAGVFALLPLLPGDAVPDPEMWPRLRAPRPEAISFAILGVATAASVLASAARIATRGRTPADLFLVAWLAIELAGFAVLSPFLAARRALGASLVGLLLCGRAAQRSLGPEGARRAVRIPLALGIALGALFAAADFADAVAVRDAVRLASERVDELRGGGGRGKVWYLGHWSFQFYAEGAGMHAVAKGRTRLHPGDWVVVPDGVSKPTLRLPGASRHPERIDVRSASPWSTHPWSYMGPLPIAPRSDAQVAVALHGVLRPFVPPRRALRPRPDAPEGRRQDARSRR